MEQTDRRLLGQIAVVTGGNRGIGAAVARGLAAAGADVAITYHRSVDDAETVQRAIQALGRRSLAKPIDVSRPEQLTALAEATRAEFGQPTIWVNLAGADILTGDFARQSDEEKLQRLVAVDLLGTVHGSWVAADNLSDGGVIINTSWDLALRGMAGREAEMFGAVKGGVTGFSLSLARSLAPGQRVNVIAPGWIETAFAQKDLSADAYEEIAQRMPMKRFGHGDDVAEAVIYLASPAASYITGQVLMINGGLTS
ncbi:SDR family oxidoreductase [Methylonatrum kenyense]|uniref:SDR family NAD(P)-dependent oxidoreductase n=1 Tax=Methylonatrum kenyense TaxID=455253 RepID=UPI0020C03093|nr:SDR family oxidoreductase [Methylonatrum kenyense]MCK8515405.1 SDR family oxidoreductase [Methylonatrum kenyense]